VALWRSRLEDCALTISDKAGNSVTRKFHVRISRETADESHPVGTLELKTKRLYGVWGLFSHKLKQFTNIVYRL